MLIKRSVNLLLLINLVLLVNGCDEDSDLLKTILSPYDSLVKVDYEEKIVDYLENNGFDCNIYTENNCKHTSIVTDGTFITFYNYSTHVYSRFDDVDGTYHKFRYTHTFDLKNGIAKTSGLYTNKNLRDYNYYSANYNYKSQIFNFDSEYSEGFNVIATRNFVKDNYIDDMIRFAEKLVNEVYEISLTEFIEADY